MRYDVKKFLFLGHLSDKALFFARAQEAGCIHFVDLDPSHPKVEPQKIQEILRSIKVLRGLPPLEQEETEDYSVADPIIDRILQLTNTLDKLEEEERVTTLEIARIAPFGDFALEDIAYIKQKGHRTLQFFCAREGFRDKVEANEIIYVGSDHALDYFVAINAEPKAYEGMIEMKIDRSLSELQKRLNAIKEEHKAADEELKVYAKYNQYLHHVLTDKLNTFNLDKAQSSVLPALDGTVFIASGFVPENATAKLAKVSEEMAVHMEQVAIEEKDRVPTYMENEGMARIGQDLVEFYDTPGTTDKDPSLWVLLFFALFFAVVVGDGGYGAVFLGLALYLRWKNPNLKGAKKRLLNLITILAVACMIWGVLVSSFFGISLNPDNPLRKLSLTHWLVTKKAEYHISAQDKFHQQWVQQIPRLEGVRDPEKFLIEGYVEKNGQKSHEVLSSYSNGILLEIALLIGIIHLCLGLLRYAKKNWTGIGWALFLIGGYLYIPYYLGVPSMLNYAFGVPFEQGAQVGLYLIGIGISVAVILAIFQRGISGILELTSIIQVFADTLSYLRLYALGLAGAIMAGIINQMAGSMPFVLAIILITLAHILNMILGIVGGVIHGLRLNFLEWYHYSFEGGGWPFKPLKLKNPEEI